MSGRNSGPSDWELHECLLAVEDAPSISAAARSLGIPRATLTTRLQLAGRRGITTRSQIPKPIEANTAEARTRIEALEAQNAALMEQLEQARAPKVPIPVASAQRQGSLLRAVFPDVHGNFMDRDAVAAFLADMELVRPDEAIGLGDLLECGGWLAQNHTLGYVSYVGQVSYEDDVAAGNEFLDRLQAIVPRVELLEGNHDMRIERWCVDQTLRNSNGGDAEFLRRRIAPEYVLSLEKRGIPYHKFSEQHDGLEVRGVIKRGRCFYSHGFSTAKHAAWQHVLQSGSPIVYGHTHRADMAFNRTIGQGLIAAWCPGTLSQLQPMWKHNSPTTWTHGYILQWVQEDGFFQTVHVPIYDGQSMLGTVLERLGLV